MSLPHPASLDSKPMRTFMRILLYTITCAIALAIAAGFVAACFIYYEISFAYSKDYPTYALPTIAMALTFAAGMLWWTTSAVARCNDGTSSETAVRMQRISSASVFRVLFAFLLAGSAAVLLFVIFQLPSVGQQSDAFVHEWPKMSHGERVLNISMLHANMALVVVAVATVCIGLPEYIYLQIRRHTARRHYLRVGVATGMVALLAFVIFAIAVSAPVDALLVTIALWTLLVCPLTAFTFWLIARPDSAAREPALFIMSFYEGQVFSLFQSLQEKHELGGFDTLSDAEKSIWVIEELQTEVNSGGFHQYFFNSAGNHASRLTVALEEVGAQQILDICREAISLFPGGRPAENWFERQAQLEEAERTLGADRVEQSLNELDERFYSLQEDLHRKLYDFAVRNGLLPASPSA